MIKYLIDMPQIKEIAKVKVDGNNLSMAGLIALMATKPKHIINIAIDSPGGYIGEKEQPKTRIRVIK